MGLVSSRIGPGPHVAGGLSGVSPGLALLSGAEFFIDASLSAVSGGKLLNLGTGGSALDATFGSTTGTDTNDPSLLPHSGVNYLYNPGVASNQWTAPSSAALNITGDIEVVRRYAADDWTPASNLALNDRDAGDPNRAWYLLVTTAGLLSFRWFSTGSAASSISANSTAAVPFSDGTTYWIKATLDVDNGAGGWTVRFWYAADQSTEPSSWTQLGADVTGAGVTSLPAVSANLSAGAAAGIPQGKDFRCIIRNGIGGTTVFDADFTRGITSGSQTTFTESSSNAATVTINRATSGRKAVAVVRPVLLLGTDDYLEVADNALLNFGASDSFTVLAVVRQWATPGGGQAIIAKQSGTIANGGYRLVTLAGPVRFDVGDGVASTLGTSTATTLGSLSAVYGIRNVTSDQIVTGSGATTNSVTDSTTASLSTAYPLRMGAQGVAGAPTSFNDMELVAAAVFRRALTAAEIAAIVAYYGAA